MTSLEKSKRLFKSEEDLQKAIESYENGASFTDLAREYNCSSSGLRNCLIVNGVTSRGQLNNKGIPYNRIHTFNENYFETIDTEEKAYWLGYLFADGCNHVDTNSISFGQSEKDKESVYKFKDCLEATQTVTIIPSRKAVINGVERMVKPHYKIEIFSKKMSQDLYNHGCVGRKTLVLEFPKIDDKLVHHFIRGYFDGDGSTTLPSTGLGNLSFTFLGTYSFLETLQQILYDKADIPITKIHDAKKGCAVSQIQGCGSNNFSKLCNFMYSGCTISSKRKHQKNNKFLKLLEEREIKRNNDSSKRWEYLTENVLKLRKEGYSKKNIAKMVGTHHVKVTTILEENNLN